MNLDALNKWLTLTANIGVLVGLVFLIIEISQNTQAINNEVESSRFNNANEVYGPPAYNSQVTEVLVTVGQFLEENGIDSFDNTNNIDHRQFQNIVYRLINYIQFRFETAQSEYELETVRALIKQQIEQPGYSEVYEFFPLEVLNPEFREFFESTLNEL